MRYPCRCNRRDCQARRTLSMRPEEYINHPSCHRPGCTGKMYVDEYRLAGGKNDRAPTCRSEDCYPYPHGMNSPHCKYREDFIIGAALAESKHNPNRLLDVPDEAPF